MRPGDGGWRRATGGVAFAVAVPGGLAAALLAALLLIWPAAGPASAETVLAVDPGYAGSYVPGWPVPVRVQVTADRLVRGRLEVELSGGAPVALPVEVPGGSQKQFLVVVAPERGSGPVQVTARLLEGSKPAATARVAARPAIDQELVGLLPGALDGRPVPGPVPLTVDVGTARFVAVREIELEQAPDSLGPLGTLAMAPNELARMSPAARRGVLAWIESGGHLLVDGEPVPAVPGLPDDWQPGDQGRAAAGIGEVRLTGGAIAAGQWSRLVEPTGRAASRSGPEFQMGPPIGHSLAGAAGLRVPAVRWLVGFLAVYVIVVGPVLFLVVRRRGRPELAWVAVPLVALLFTTGSYAAGRGVRRATRLVHASILNTGPAGTTAHTYLGVFSRSGETVGIGLPPGWLPAAVPEMEGSILSRLESVAQTADGPDVRLPLDAGQFGLVKGGGPVDSQGALEVTATSGENGRAAGRVRNGTRYPLSEAVVFVGGTGSLVGSLAPGEERGWELTGAGNPENGPPAEFRAWSTGRDMSRAGDLALWEAARAESGPDFRAPGAAVVAGWTDGFDPPLRMSGRHRSPAGRTLVIGRGPVRPSSPTPSDVAVRREMVRDAGTAGGATVVRFVVPGGSADGRALFLRPPTPTFEVWQDGTWAQLGSKDCRQVPGAPPGVVDCGGGFRGGPQPQAEVALPAAAADGGLVYVRLPSIPTGALDGRGNGLFTLRVAGA